MNIIQDPNSPCLYGYGTLTDEQLRNLNTTPLLIFNGSTRPKKHLVQQWMLNYKTKTKAHIPGGNFILQYGKTPGGLFASKGIWGGIVGSEVNTDCASEGLFAEDSRYAQPTSQMQGAPLYLTCLDLPPSGEGDGVLSYYVSAILLDYI